MILAALFLLTYNRYEDEHAGQEAESMLAEVQSIISERAAEEAPPLPKKDEEEATEPELTVTQIEGYDYIGCLSIPSLALELPVMSEWDYNRLKLAPCRQFGSTATDDLVIAAHNYKSHFGYLGQLEIGAKVTFTDMDGTVNTYAVEALNILKPTSVAEVQNSGYDLVLYTCTKGGKTRITVFCNRTDDTAA